MPLSEETDGGSFSFLPSVVLTKEVIMRKVKLVVHECYAVKSEEVFAAAFLSNDAALTEHAKTSRIINTNQSRGSLCFGKGAENGTSEI